MYSSFTSKEERERQKELIKSLETPEEKRLRRLAKKEYKERKMKAALGWGEEYLGFTNQQNPYGDDNLLQKFVWHKKDELEQQSDTSTLLDQKRTSETRAKEARLELEKLKKRRLEREREKAEREREREFLQREKEAEYYKEWEHHEDAFHLEQVRLRSRIRIQDGRAKPIDLLARYIDEIEGENKFKCDDDGTAAMHPVETCFSGLNKRDLEDLLADIDVYTRLDSSKHSRYWHDVTIITKDYLNKLGDDDQTCKTATSDHYGINSVVAKDVEEIFQSKTYPELQTLETSIKAKVFLGGEHIDVGYWESLLSKLHAYMAKARLQLRHREFLRKKLDQLRSKQKLVSTNLFPIGFNNSSNSKQSGRYSPTLIDPSTLDIGQYVMDEDELSEKLVLKRAQVIGTGYVIPDVEDAFEKRARQGITGKVDDNVSATIRNSCQDTCNEKCVRESLGDDNDSENVAVEEIPLEFRYLWSDKYRPRKPRFFNKVHTGYDWNQYNKKHYDTDNPPPKTVQGYKFNIFYPDLIDRAKAPSYDLKICEDTRDFAILRFHAGPPYEDIAFKIVNKEWDFSYKHGLRCQFQNGIFQLWFHFRKWKYRR
ncbi:hypothetical protein GJ496_000727 [Pomphorhynchus laevis]|nr:hypothetical protein GJ496_000727 [Pomphorhynchus laevis]